MTEATVETDKPKGELLEFSEALRMDPIEKTDPKVAINKIWAGAFVWAVFIICFFVGTDIRRVAIAAIERLGQ